MGSRLKKQKKSDDIKESKVEEYKEMRNKLFHLGHYKVRVSDGGFPCPFCASEDDAKYESYAHLLQQAIQVSEGSTSTSTSTSRKLRAKHSAMARYLAFDLADEVNAAVSDGGKHCAGIGVKQIEEIDANVFKRACRKIFTAREAEIRGVELCSMWQAKLNDTYLTVKEGDAVARRLKKEWGDEACNAIMKASKDINKYSSIRNLTKYELWSFEENWKANVEEVSSWLRNGRAKLLNLKYIVVSIK